MTRKARVETANNGWVLILTEMTPPSPASSDRVAEKMVFTEWSKLVIAIERWLGPDSAGGPHNL